jgi:hypothetical protein
MWRKSLAWLDYNFALARKSNPAYVIVGSYDDPTERNAWLISDTAHCELGRQMRDKTGALSSSAYYDRVREWVAGKPAVEPGGLLRDGAYRMVNRSSGKGLDAEKANRGAPGAMIVESSPAKAPFGLFWLYHLGGNRYRIIALWSGLPLEASDEAAVIQNWDSTDPRQRWTLSRTRDGYCRLKNDGTGKKLALDDGSAVLHAPSADPEQQWRIEPVLTL